MDPISVWGGGKCRGPPHHLAFLWVPQLVFLSSKLVLLPQLCCREAPGGLPALLGV